MSRAGKACCNCW